MIIFTQLFTRQFWGRPHLPWRVKEKFILRSQGRVPLMHFSRPLLIVKMPYQRLDVSMIL